MGKSEKVEINVLTKRKAEKLWVNTETFSGRTKHGQSFPRKHLRMVDSRRGFPNMGKSSASEEE